MLLHLGLALVIWLTGFALFGRFIVPRWKVGGKLIFYLAVTALLSAWLGNWALIWIVGHPGLGVAGHIWWCRQHGINWITCQPRDRYMELRPWAAADGFARGND
jgi:hypothetical protein